MTLKKVVFSAVAAGALGAFAAPTPGEDVFGRDDALYEIRPGGKAIESVPAEYWSKGALYPF